MGTNLSRRGIIITLCVVGVGLLGEFYFLVYGTDATPARYDWLIPIVFLIGLVVMAPIVNLVQNLLGAFILAPLFGAIAWLAHLLPWRLRQKLGENAGRPLSRSTGLALIGGFVVALIALFAWRFHTLSVIIPFIMAAIVAGLFSLVRRIDLRLQARKARRSTDANNTPDGIRRPADGSPKPSV